MQKKTVQDVKVANKRVFVRVDFNVPFDETSGEITDDSRIRAALPTINYLIQQKAKVILCSHLGRPKGRDSKFSLAKVAQRLSGLIGRPVIMAEDTIGPEVEEQVSRMKSGNVMMLENVRFYPEEEKNDDSFAQSLSKLADVYVNDAFGTLHRAHASIVGITKYLPAVAGFLVEKELELLGTLLTNPSHPFAALLGGAKISDKVGMLENIIKKVDCIMIGGGMAATFLKAKSYEVGQSLVESDRLPTAKALMEKIGSNGVRLLLPVDVLVASEVSAQAQTKTVPVDKIPPNMRIVDSGKQTTELFCKELSNCKTVFWNGPMGIYEVPQFAEGTNAIAKCLAGLDGKTIIGGGSTSEVVHDLGLTDKMTFVSTGGGASLEFLSGSPLPGVTALLDKKTARVST